MDKKYDFRKVEKELKTMWEEKQVYKYQKGRERKIFSIDKPPPTVSGKLHIGHVFPTLRRKFGTQGRMQLKIKCLKLLQLCGRCV